MDKIAEYVSLRGTIRERGSVRMCSILIGLIGWAALALALIAADLEGGVTLIPFLVLAATFEISFFIHTGVERIGRYIQVSFEEASGVAGWETTAMNYGRDFPAQSDPLFVTIFAAAAALDFMGSLAMATRRPAWVLLSLAVHVVFGYRLVAARRLAAGQRTLDLERLRKLRSSEAEQVVGRQSSVASPSR
jgi:hypothetical protein